MRYKSDRIIDGKRRTIIIEDGKIINRNPNKEELKILEEEPFRKSYTNSELLEYLKRFYEENGRVPIANDFNNTPKYPNFNRYINSFGSWNKAIEISGLLDKRKKRHPVLYTNDELLGYLKKFYEENGRSPIVYDFTENPRYPNYGTYQIRFGGWQSALKLVGLDMDTMVRNGILSSKHHKGRLFEIYVLEHFIEESIDLSQENCNSPIDGICPNKKTYDAKSSCLINNRYFVFSLNKIYRERIDYFYLGGFDEDYQKLLHVWRIPGDFINGPTLYISNLCCQHRFERNIENMKDYEITDKFKDIDVFKK